MELSFPVQGLLSSSQTASILEAGLTYVLYQRGQIPLPYQQLQMSASQHKKLEEAGIAAGQKSGDSSCYGGETPQLNPRERISSMVFIEKIDKNAMRKIYYTTFFDSFWNGRSACFLAN